MLCDMLADLGCEAVCVDCPVKGLKKIAYRWVYDTKFDGYRSQLHLRAGKPAVYTRSGLNWTPKFAPIAAAAVDPPAIGPSWTARWVVQDDKGCIAYPIRREAAHEVNKSARELESRRYQGRALRGRYARPRAKVEEGLPGCRNRHGRGHKHRPAGFSASSGEDVAVAVPEVALYPAVLYSRINPPLEIAVPNFEELVPSQKSFDGDIVFREHHEDLPCGVTIGL